MKNYLILIITISIFLTACNNAGDAVKITSNSGGSSGGGTQNCYDVDEDGFLKETSICPQGNDCNDLNESINPGANETFNGIDDNCNGEIDEGADNPCDMDRDGFLDLSCQGLDCNDLNESINPNATEICDDGIDNDCNPETSDICQVLGDLSFEYTQLPESYNNAYGKFIGDISGDGYPDLIIGDANGGGLVWYEYPSWQRHTIKTGSFGEDLQAVDVDNDGYLDLVVGRRSTNQGLKWIENPLPSDPRTTSWTEHTIYSSSIKIHDLEIGKINNDNLIDVVIRFERENLKPPYVLLQTNTGWNLISSTGTNPASNIQEKGEGTAIGDLDGDGDNDLVHNRFWLENINGDGTSWQKHVFDASQPERMLVRIFDINNDGTNEIISTPQSVGVHNLAYYTTSDSGITWQAHIIESSITRMHGLEIGDFDLDGNLDLSTSFRHDLTGSNDEVSIYLNNGELIPSFEKYVIATSGSHFHKIGDVGSDGDLDVFGVNWAAGYKPDLWENQIIS